MNCLFHAGLLTMGHVIIDISLINVLVMTEIIKMFVKEQKSSPTRPTIQ